MAEFGISRERAMELLREHVKTENSIKHMLATEAIMRALAERFGEDVDAWGLTGLLHDLDIEQTQEDPSRHAVRTCELLRDEGVAEEYLGVIRKHAAEFHENEKRESVFEHALAAAETITGLVVTTALVYPDKKLASVKVKSIRKRMKDKRFAASVSREVIKECELIDVPLDDFCELALDSMRTISEELGL